MKDKWIFFNSLLIRPVDIIIIYFKRNYFCYSTMVWNSLEFFDIVYLLPSIYLFWNLILSSYILKMTLTIFHINSIRAKNAYHIASIYVYVCVCVSVVKGTPLITYESKRWWFKSSHCYSCNFAFFVQEKNILN